MRPSLAAPGALPAQDRLDDRPCRRIQLLGRELVGVLPDRILEDVRVFVDVPMDGQSSARTPSTRVTRFFHRMGSVRVPRRSAVTLPRRRAESS